MKMETIKETFDRLHPESNMARYYRICKQFHRERLVVNTALSSEYLKLHEQDWKDLQKEYSVVPRWLLFLCKFINK